MEKIVECIPNFSEGRRRWVVDAIVEAIKSVEGIKMLDVEMDWDHNRSVISFVGNPEAVVEAAFRGAQKAVELIDLNKHKGEHPRMGAVDVIPFVPVRGVTMDECIELANKLAKRIADELKMPVYLYEEAARVPERKDLANIRKGEFEGLREAIKTDPSRKPDYGPCEVHPTAGAVAVGARKPLIAFNVNLGTQDIKVARRIARRVRFRSGGLYGVKALGFEIKEKNCVQVSMNLIDYQKTPVWLAYENVKLLAERYGVPVIESEIVGLIPVDAVRDIVKFYLKANDFKSEQILEMKMMGLGETIEEIFNKVASSKPTPGGGGVSALSYGMGMALLSMVCGLTLKKKKYKDREKYLKPILDSARKEVYRALELFDEDSEAFKLMMRVMRGGGDVEGAILKAIEVPMEVMKGSLKGVEWAEEVAKWGFEGAITDVGCANLQFKSAYEGAKYNVLINLKSLENKEKRGEIKEELKKMDEGFYNKARVVEEKIWEGLRDE